MESPLAYIPMDRRQALAQGASLPERSVGAALFADISGFTPLTEALVRALGAQRGAEELPRQLNQVYDALIAEVDRFGGSVLGFAGDAITCWFDNRVEQTGAESDKEAGRHGDHAPPASVAQSPGLLGPGAELRASACALALQQAMAAFALVHIPGAGEVSLAIKVGVASGPVRRFLVGDPSIQTIDVLAGATLEQMVLAEHLAEKGDVIVDTATATALGERAEIVAWREDAASGARFAVLRGLRGEAPIAPWPPLPEGALSEAAYRAWLLPPVFERLRVAMGAFLTELRPIVALFLRFGGIDYDDDPLAQAKLDAFMIWAQRILRAYDGYILQLTIGDKGSFFYAALGAPIAHEDDAVRALMAALELRDPQLSYLEPVQIGLSQGRARTGAYGGVTRRTYGALGDDVNLAARLMQHAPAGQVLVSQSLRRSSGDRFNWAPQAPLRVKGKAEPVSTYRLVGINTNAVRLHEPRYALPMVGRLPELHFVLERLALAERGYGQIVGISADAGMGKSRLVAEVVRNAWARNLVAYGGECQSYGINTPYLVWQSIWRAFFGLDGAEPADEQIGALRVALARINPALLPRLPLLGTLLNLPIAENELTRDFDARLRKESLEALLVSCLRARSSELPILIVLEDCHWIDPLSHDLLEVLGRALTSMAVMILMAYRPPQLQRLTEPRVTALAHFREMPLDSLQPEEVAALVRLKLGQFFGDIGAVPNDLVERINLRTQGNPFYVEELLNLMHDQGIDPRNTAALAVIELPDSLHSLILSRIDRLSESQKSLIKVASVIGRLFRAAILWGVGAFFGQQEQVRRELEELSALELTPLDTPEPELTYLFKHIVTQEVTYESLPFATRAVIHEQIAQHIERSSVGQDQLVDLLAFHYDRSENRAKRCEYLLRAGSAAQAIYANNAALDYFTRLLAILPEAEQADPSFRLGQVLELVGRWDEAEAYYRKTLDLAETQGDGPTAARCRAYIGEILRKQGRFAEALSWIDQALAAFAALGDQAGLAQTLNFAAHLGTVQGEYDLATTRYEASLAIWRQLDELSMVGSALSNLGIMAYYQNDSVGARQRFTESLAVRRKVGNPLWIANSLGNLGMLAIEEQDYIQARPYVEESLAIERATGDRAAIAISLNNLGKVLTAQGDYGGARAIYGEALQINRDLGDRWALTYLIEDLGILAGRTDQPERALRLVGAAAALREALNAPLSPPELAQLEAALAPARAVLSAAEQAAASSQGRAMSVEQAVAEALTV